MKAGFTLKDIKELTLDQINLFLKCAGRAQNAAMWQTVIATLAGSRYDEKGLGKLQRQLEQ